MAKAIHKHKRLLAWGVVLTLTFLQGLIWWAGAPPWTAPDEPGHFLYVRLFVETGHTPTPADITPRHWEAILDSLETTGWQQYVHPLTPTAGLTRDPLLTASGLQVGQKPPGYYALAAVWLHLHPGWQTLPSAAQLRWIRLLSLLLRLLTTLTALFLATRLWPEQPMRILSLGLLAGLLPMVGFIGGSLNNDALSLAWGAAAFTALVLARSPLGWLLTLLLILAGPLLVDVSLLFLWPLALLRWTLFVRPAHALQLKPIAALRRPLLTGAIALLLLVGLLLLPNPRRANGWRWQNAAQTRQSGQLFLQAKTSPARLTQTHSGKDILKRGGQTLTLTARVAGRGEALLLRLNDSAHQVEIRCPLTPAPQTCRQTLTLTPGSQHISVSALLPAGKASFQIALTDASGLPLLINGDGSQPAPLAAPLFTWLERHLPLPAGFFSRLLAPGVWDAPSLLRYGLYVGFTWASFWGYFGWLNRPYPWATYLLLAAATLAALIGLGRRWSARHHDDEGILIFSLLAAILILLQTWLPMLGNAWQPQGRYLFPALLPIAMLLLSGWETLLPARRRTWLPALLFVALLLLNLQAWQIIQP